MVKQYNPSNKKNKKIQRLIIYGYLQSIKSEPKKKIEKIWVNMIFKNVQLKVSRHKEYAYTQEWNSGKWIEKKMEKLLKRSIVSGYYFYFSALKIIK